MKSSSALINAPLYGHDEGIAGYKGIGPEQGVNVDKQDAFKYALNRCLNGSEEEQKEFRDMLENWFFSGNFVRRVEDEN